MSEMKVGIVIQGPLISKGRTGKTAHISLSEVTEDDIVEFNCIPLIKNVFHKYNKDYEIVCVVWDSEPENLVSELREYLPEKAIHIVIDDTRKLPAKGKVIPGNNGYRQIKSSLAGFDVLSGRGCTHLIKIRSDQEVNISTLIMDYKRTTQGKLLLPYLRPDVPDWIADFYFMGKASFISDLFRKYLDAPQRLSSLHRDLFYCWASELVGEPKWPFKLRESSLYKGYVRNVWSHLSPGSRTLYEGVVWRGEPLKRNQPERAVFLEDLVSESGPFNKIKIYRSPVIKLITKGLLRRARRLFGMT